MLPLLGEDQDSLVRSFVTVTLTFEHSSSRPSVHYQKVPIPHPRDGDLRFTANSVGTRWKDWPTAQLGHNRVRHEVQPHDCSSLVGQVEPYAAVAPRRGRYAQALQRPEEEREIFTTTCQDEG